MTHLDPITVEVIGSAMASIVEEMGEALVRSSYSTNIKERRDCSTALFDNLGNTLCQAEHIPMHLGSFIGIISHILERHDGNDILPGDVFIGNDAYVGGATHLPDIVLAEPIHFDGVLVAWSINTAHHADFADRGHEHIYQEGIRIPPVRLYCEGELQADIQDIFLLNCQVPRERLSDLRAQMSANRLGVQRVKGLCKKYGVDKVIAAGSALQDYAERKMRAGIAAIANGTYRFTDVFESNQFPDILELSVEIKVQGEAMTLTFDAPPQVRAGLNMVYTALLASCYYAVKSAIDPTILPNSGLSRPLTVSAPEASILNCVHPAAVDGRIAASQRVADLILGALSKAMPDKISAAGNGCCTGATFSGTRKNGDIWVYLETIGGGGGARPTSDGLSGIQVHMTNTSNLPVEGLELEYPLTLMRYELVDGSAGSGTFRGGQGIRRVYRIEEACRLSLDTSRLRSQPWGLSGGSAGQGSKLNFGDDRNNFAGMIDLEPGQIIEIVTAGGGGYGSPKARNSDSAKRDLQEGRMRQIPAQNIRNLHHVSTGVQS